MLQIGFRFYALHLNMMVYVFRCDIPSVMLLHILFLLPFMFYRVVFFAIRGPYGALSFYYMPEPNILIFSVSD